MHRIECSINREKNRIRSLSISVQVPLHLQSPAQFYPGLSGCLMGLDSIEIHRDSTVAELKALILTLPAVSVQHTCLHEINESRKEAKINVRC